jgi:hypothetical protein
MFRKDFQQMLNESWELEQNGLLAFGKAIADDDVVLDNSFDDGPVSFRSKDASLMDLSVTFIDENKPIVNTAIGPF